jgi:hypothetical protein
MKKIIVFLVLMVTFAALNAQCVTRTLVPLSYNQTVYNYPGTGVSNLGDTINGGTVDTLRFPVQVSLDQPFRVFCEITLTARAGADTTYLCAVYGRNSLNAAWTKTEAIVTSSAVSTVQYPVCSNLSTAYTLVSGTCVYTGDSTKNSTTPNACLQYTAAAQTFTYTPTNSDLFYRYLMVEVIASGNDAVGTGVKVTGFTLKLYKK